MNSAQSVSKEGRDYRRGEPSDIATLRWFPSPKDLHVLNPKRFLNAGFAGERNFNPAWGENKESTFSYEEVKINNFNVYSLSEFSYRKILSFVH